jgi:hypothetical protein
MLQTRDISSRHAVLACAVSEASPTRDVRKVLGPSAGNDLTQDEESSGVADATSLLGAGWWLLNVQAHPWRDLKERDYLRSKSLQNTRSVSSAACS